MVAMDPRFRYGVTLPTNSSNISNTDNYDYGNRRMHSSMISLGNLGSSHSDNIYPNFNDNRHQSCPIGTCPIGPLAPEGHFTYSYGSNASSYPY